MSYWDIAEMARDNDLTAREAAAAAQEMRGPDPFGWIANHRLQLAASPDWADAWAAALEAGTENPGQDPAVITDAMILSAVQLLMAEQANA